MRLYKVLETGETMKAQITVTFGPGFNLWKNLGSIKKIFELNVVTGLVFNCDGEDGKVRGTIRAAREMSDVALKIRQED